MAEDADRSLIELSIAYNEAMRVSFEWERAAIVAKQFGETVKSLDADYQAKAARTRAVSLRYLIDQRARRYL